MSSGKNTKEIIIHHKITVDSCLAKEIEELNNRYGVVTDMCCCGHGDKRTASISVKLTSRDRMYAMGYKPVKGAWQDVIFYPKSKCTCKQTRKCIFCGKVRRGWAVKPNKPFYCYECAVITDHSRFVNKS